MQANVTLTGSRSGWPGDREGPGRGHKGQEEI